MSNFQAQNMSHHPTGNLRLWLWIAGLASIALGLVAIAYPFAATLAVELLVGAVLAVSGVVQMLRAIVSENGGARLWMLGFGVVSLLAGAVLLLYPLQGTLTLTIFMASFFVAGGVMKMMSAWFLSPDQRTKAGLAPVDGWWWVGMSGALSLILGILLIAGLPATAVWALGLLIGIDLLFLGLTEIAFAMALGRADRRG